MFTGYVSMAYAIQIFDSLGHSNFPYGTKKRILRKRILSIPSDLRFSKKMEIIRNELSCPDKTPKNYKKKHRDSNFFLNVYSKASQSQLYDANSQKIRAEYNILQMRATSTDF